MLTPIIQIFTSRAAGPAASAVAVLLAAVLALTWSDAQRTQAQLRGEIGELTREAGAAGAYWQARVASCEGASPSQPRTIEVAARDANASPEERARRLANEPPTGFDVCARMESADQAVLNALK